MSAGSYVIKGGQVGRDRLRVLSRVLQPTTGGLLERLAVAPSAKVLDVGCGGGDVTLSWARLVPEGRVVGIDVDDTKVAIARDDADASGARNVEFRVGDVGDADLGRESFDVVYARFLLCHLPDPERVLQRMFDAVVPGGLLVVEDTDIDGSVAYPPSAAFARSLDLYTAALRGRGGDPNIGWRVPLLMQDVGVTDIAMDVVQPAGVTGDAKTIQTLTLAATRDAIVAAGLATGDEVDQVAAELAAFVARPDTVVTVARIVQTWGRKPAAADAASTSG